MSERRSKRRCSYSIWQSVAASKLVTSILLVVEYFPEYRLGRRGTRSFEMNGGFQAMKSVIKWAVFEGFNYDIKSSQLTILGYELERYDIKCKRLTKITKKKIMRRFNVDQKVAKLLIYTLIYSLGSFVSIRIATRFVRFANCMATMRR